MSTAVDLARAQFAFTICFHILWPTLTIGLSAYLTLLAGLWWRTGDEVWHDLLRFWRKIFAIAFGIGVTTGVVISYEIGTNWSGLSKVASNVVGPMFMYEALTAFFLEAGFIGVMLLGDKRVGKGAYFFACAMVALGTLLSSTWILASNSWLQTPQGATMDADGVFHVTSWAQAILTPSFPYRLAHMVCASFVTGAFVVAGVSAFHLWRGVHPVASRRAYSMALALALLLVPLQMIIGDAHGRNTLEYQPVKLAAMEGLWDTTRGAPMTIIGWPSMSEERNLFAIDIPHVASLYLTHSWNGEVPGLKSVPAADRPYVPIVFFAFRIMVGIAVLLLATAITGAVLRVRGRLYAARWFHFVTMATTPLGFVAVLAGWITTEAGRQPWVVYGQLRTADAVSPVAAGAVGTTLAVFVVIYFLLLAAFLWFGGRIAIRGPEGGPSTGSPLPPYRPAPAGNAQLPVPLAGAPRTSAGEP